MVGEPCSLWDHDGRVVFPVQGLFSLEVQYSPLEYLFRSLQDSFVYIIQSHVYCLLYNVIFYGRLASDFAMLRRWS